MPTIHDVAREAGVSVSTVSRVIMARPNVHEATRRRVQEVVDRLGYRPSAIARGLVSQRTKTLGVVVSDISNPFYPQAIKGVEDIADEHGYTIILCNTDDDLERNRRVFSVLQEQRVDGLIVGSLRLDDPSFGQLFGTGTPVVLFNRGLPGDSVSQVVLNNRKGAELATNHLIELGRRRLVHLSGPGYAQNARERARGFTRTARAAGIAAADRRVVEVDFHPLAHGDAARPLISELLARDDRPDGILAVNDVIAANVMETVVFELGLKVPEDVAIVGFDDSHLAASRFVQISTVRHHPYEMGARAAEMLISRIRGAQAKWPRKVVLEPRLAARASTLGRRVPAHITAPPLGESTWPVYHAAPSDARNR